MLTIRGAESHAGSAILSRVTLPPEPAMSPLRQTLSWAVRPLPFMERCRRDLGDSFSIMFLGFERPMVMLSDPVAIKALYTEREHGLPLAAGALDVQRDRAGNTRPVMNLSR